MLRRIAIAVAVLAVLAGVALVHTWRQATALPQWAVEDEAGVDDTQPQTATPGEDAPLPPAAVWVEVPADPDATPAPEASAGAEPEPPKRRELRNFHLRSAAKNVVAAKAIRKSRAVYDDGKLEAGVIVNLSKIPRKKLKPEDRKLLDRAFRAFPALRERSVYVGIEDEPVSRRGYLQLGRKTVVRVGKLRYPMAKVARKLGIDAAQVRKQLNRELRRLKVTDPDAGR